MGVQHLEYRLVLRGLPALCFQDQLQKVTNSILSNPGLPPVQHV